MPTDHEPVDVATLDDPEPDCTLVEELDELLVELPLVVADVLLEFAALVTITVPSAPAPTMPRPARIAVRRRAVRRPVSRMFMRCPFVGVTPP